MPSRNQFQILAYYRFTPIADPHAEVANHKQFCEGKDILARVYLSEMGINGQMSASQKDAAEYIAWMEQHPLFKGVEFKVQPYHEHVFPRLTIKYRKQLVALDSEVDLTQGGEYVTPQQWKELLDGDEEYVLLDVRNDYEWKVGRFKGAELPPCENFREFQQFAEDLKSKIGKKKTPVLMYCTGGIRCEVYSAFLKARGIENIMQLHGGIIKYGEDVGSDHWQGKLFVFDDRLTVPVSNGETEMIGTCHHCGTNVEAYYNCANMKCNYLFLCCPACLKAHEGCCKTECAQSDRLRPYHQQNPHKPFRKWYHYFQEHSKELKDKRQNDQKD